MAASLAVALLGGGVAYAGDDGDHGEDGEATTETTNTTEVTETTDTTEVTDSTRPTAPEELVAAVTAYRAAVSDWRHCIIDMVSGDAETDTCGGAPSPDDFGLSEEDILSYDLDQRIAKRVDRLLTRVEIKTTCLAAHAAEGRTAVFECVFEAIRGQSGERGDRVDGRHSCDADKSPESETTAVGSESSDKDATEGTCHRTEDRVRDRRGDRQGDGGTGRAGADTGGRRGTHDG